MPNQDLTTTANVTAHPTIPAAAMSEPSRQPTRRQPAEYADRDRAILRLAWREQAIVAAAVSARFLEGKQAGHVLRRLEAKGWLELESGAIPGGVTYATLTPKGGEEIGVVVRPKPIGGAGLDAAIAVSGYCFLGENADWRRRRLLSDEVHGLDGGFAANVPHVLTTEFGAPSVLRVQLAISGKPRAVLAKADETFAKAARDPEGANWVRSLAYGVVVLAPTPERVSQLEAAAKDDQRFEGKRLAIGLGPTSETLAAALRQRRKR